MKTLTRLALTALAATICATASAQNFFDEPLKALGPKQKEYRALAVKGDYQGMRNIAHSYAAPLKGEAGSPVASCAWYLLIPAVHKDKFTAGDTGNVHTYCGKLEAGEVYLAYNYAFRTLAGAK